MTRKDVPAYFQWRDGRPRWEPGPSLRRKGFKGQDLKAENGDWLSRGQAFDVAEALNAAPPRIPAAPGSDVALPPTLPIPPPPMKKSKAPTRRRTLDSDIDIEYLLARYQLRVQLPELPEKGYFVYVFGSGSKVKIGFSTNVRQRHRDLSQARDHDLRILMIAPALREDEAYLKSLFAAYRIRGEWFRYSGMLAEWLLRCEPPILNPMDLKGRTKRK